MTQIRAVRAGLKSSRIDAKNIGNPMWNRPECRKMRVLRYLAAVGMIWLDLSPIEHYMEEKEDGEGNGG